MTNPLHRSRAWRGCFAPKLSPGFLFLAAVLIAVGGRVVVLQYTPSSRACRREAIEFIDKANQLLLIVAPRASGLALTAQSSIVKREPAGPDKQYWFVTCTDSADKDVAEFHWDAETGKLVMLSVIRRPTADQNRQICDPEAAAERAAYWSSLLGFAPPPAPGSSPWIRETNSGWAVKWPAERDHVFIRLDRASGHILTASCLSP